MKMPKEWNRSWGKGMGKRLRTIALEDEILLRDILEEIVNDEDTLAKVHALGYEIRRIEPEPEAVHDHRKED